MEFRVRVVAPGDWRFTAIVDEHNNWRVLGRLRDEPELREMLAEFAELGIRMDISTLSHLDGRSIYANALVIAMPGSKVLSNRFGKERRNGMPLVY